ncbi:hypothetical protein H8S37_03995 [Mediterraneibacter sp. NSJ-55]|uniref:Uncharacterized protein n=1 Tax=Mediterraneibacter hominis TaxID=2763054 RepID=A0A923RP50_9FIRM|nr:hypothetical protein [Mediterraneibacter hominis]MBC5688095.1 hypothetical protein [Mediterraneibacter hominis]
MELYPGKMVKIKDYNELPRHWMMSGRTHEWMGKIVTIAMCYGKKVKIKEDNLFWAWNVEEFEDIE